MRSTEDPGGSDTGILLRSVVYLRSLDPPYGVRDASRDSKLGRALRLGDIGVSMRRA